MNLKKPNKEREDMKNFVEAKTLDEANDISLNDYTFLERLSAKRGTWCFKIREAKR